ncbi:probable serine/threonine protein kinase IREH1 isoform X1 [Tanacetum coccineum]
MNELANIARCARNTPLDDDRSQSYLLECLEDLKVVTERRKFDALTVETFGERIEKLIREKYMQLFELVDDEKINITSTIIDKDAPFEDDVVLLKKADMIRKNAVESILAERDILISMRNPFVMIMEYLNGGDLYSLLRNLGCLDEDVARVYIAEVVLALEYLHSLRVVHRDLKPDNLLIAHDGHIKVRLINSTDDLSGPAVSGTSLMGEHDESESSLSESQQERRKNSRLWVHLIIWHQRFFWELDMVPWSNERPLENKELNAIIGAWFTLWRD